MIRRLRVKFICINMVIVTTMLLVIFGMVLGFTGANLEQQSIRMMETVAEDRLFLGRPGEGRQEVPLPYFVVNISIWGEISAVSNGFYDLSDQEALLEIVEQARCSTENRGLLRQYSLRFLKNSGLFGERIVFVDISGEIDTMESLGRSCVLIGLLSFAVFLLISVLLARWAVKPVEQAWNQQRQFVADASHELKTPLTVIMTNAELLSGGAYEQDQRQQFIDSILTMSRQMRGLVESLLELARVDNGTAKMAFSQLDFSELVEEGLLPFEPMFFEQELQLRSYLEPGVFLRGSGPHLKQVLDILLDNAAKYAAPGGPVEVSLRKSGNHCLLAISNPGPEISREDLKHIFRRFYRADKARTMNRSYGLGLAIAQSIVAEHGGKIWAESENGINTFFVQLPIR